MYEKQYTGLVIRLLHLKAGSRSHSFLYFQVYLAHFPIFTKQQIGFKLDHAISPVLAKYTENMFKVAENFMPLSQLLAKLSVSPKPTNAKRNRAVKFASDRSRHLTGNFRNDWQFALSLRCLLRHLLSSLRTYCLFRAFYHSFMAPTNRKRAYDESFITEHHRTMMKRKANIIQADKGFPGIGWDRGQQCWACHAPLFLGNGQFSR